METIQVGWFWAVIIGGLAGWLAGKFMNSRYGVFMNIILGVVGSAVATTLLRQFSIVPEDGRLAFLVTGFLGASLLIFVARLIRR